MKRIKSGFTLIELLVVIGILAVLAAIAIPAVAGLIDRANVAHDNTNANEMTNSIERFVSEYELYKQDVAMNMVDGEMDAMQGRVYNVVGVTTRNELGAMEGVNFDKDTLYPLTREDARKVIGGYMKTTSKTFDPKQSDKCYWYAPSCGVVVVGDSYASASKLNELVISGKDAKGNDLTPDTVWIDLTCGDDVQPDVPVEDPSNPENELDWMSLFGGNPGKIGSGSDVKVINVDYRILVPGGYGTEFYKTPVDERYDFRITVDGRYSIDGEFLPMTDEKWAELNNDPVNFGEEIYIDNNGNYFYFHNTNNGGSSAYGFGTYDDNSQTYDEATDTLTVTFTNGMVLELRGISTDEEQNPLLKVDGNWYKWKEKEVVASTNIAIQDMIPVSDSEYSDTTQEITSTQVMFVPDNGNGMSLYGQLSIKANNNYSDITDANLIAFDFEALAYEDLSDEKKAEIDAIGGLDSVSLKGAFGYAPADGKTYIIDPSVMMSQPPAQYTFVSANYDAGSNTTTLVMQSGANEITFYISNASGVWTNATLEISINGSARMSLYTMIA